MTIKLDFLPGEYKIIQALAKRQKKSVKTFIKERIISLDEDIMREARRKLNRDCMEHLEEEARTLYA